MGFIKLAIAGTAAYGLFQYFRHNRSEESPAFAKGEGAIADVLATLAKSVFDKIEQS